MFRELFGNACIIKEHFNCFEQQLRAQSLRAQGAQMIDVTLGPVPTQRNTRSGNKIIKEAN
ncbi:IS5 family transposase [Synechococcus sp. ROS8604]|nr:IS5 family transposase [Synechococcus sp. ROS8604]